LPDIATVSEFVPGYEASVRYGVGAPKNTPSQIIDKLNEAINASLADPKLQARLADLGGTPTGRPTSRQTDAAVPIQYSVTPVPRMAAA
jgi:tripartite-type tricarboxylate transporter receptor subunit TctC